LGRRGGAGDGHARVLATQGPGPGGPALHPSYRVGGGPALAQHAGQQGATDLAAADGLPPRRRHGGDVRSWPRPGRTVDRRGFKVNEMSRRAAEAGGEADAQHRLEPALDPLVERAEDAVELVLVDGGVGDLADEEDGVLLADGEGR